MPKKFLDQDGLATVWGKAKEIFQPKLVSGTDIKTVNGNSLLGSGDIEISGGNGIIESTESPFNIYTKDSGIYLIKNASQVYYGSSGSFTIDNPTLIYIQKYSNSYITWYTIPNSLNRDLTKIQIRWGYCNSTGTTKGADSRYLTYIPTTTYQPIYAHHITLTDPDAGADIRPISFIINSVRSSAYTITTLRNYLNSAYLNCTTMESSYPVAGRSLEDGGGIHIGIYTPDGTSIYLVYWLYDAESNFSFQTSDISNFTLSDTYLRTY